MTDRSTHAPDAPVDGGAAEESTIPADSTPTSGRSDGVASGAWIRIVGLAAAGIFAISGVAAYFVADRDEDLKVANDRDTALVAANGGIETLNTLDYRKVDEGLADWVEVSTGTLQSQFSEIDDEARQLLADQKKITEGKVIESAVVDVDDETATVIAAVEVSVADGSGEAAEPTVKRNRFVADLVLVDGDWKIENLQQVAVTLS